MKSNSTSSTIACSSIPATATRALSLEPQTTADFYSAVTTALRELDMPVRINARSNEVEPAIPFARDREHASYNPEATHRFWKALVQADRLLGEFRAGFTGKTSPSHFFWGSFDLAVTREAAAKAGKRDRDALERAFERRPA